MEEKAIVAVQTGELSVDEVRSQVEKVQQLMKSIMRKDEHYGVIPGTDKPSLYKPGAEKLNFTFRFSPEYAINRVEMPEGHREYEIVCTLRHMISGTVVAQGVGSCSTMESKYRYRNAARTCPLCGKEAIIKGKEEYGGGWVCYKKKDGCGAKFSDNDPRIVDQPAGKVENPDIADVYNTVLKIAKKRALVDATITACAASDIFTQDVEDFVSAETVTVEVVGESREKHGKETKPETANFGSSDISSADGDISEEKEQLRYKLDDALADGKITQAVHRTWVQNLSHASASTLPKMRDAILSCIK